MKRLGPLLLALLMPTVALASQPMSYTFADATVRTSEMLFSRIPAYTASDQTLGTNGVVARIVPGAAETTGSTTTFAPPPFPTRLRVNAFDTGSNSSALTCTSCSITGYNSLGILVSETVLTIDESTENLTENSYERVTAFSCAGCANMLAGDVIKLNATDHLALDVPIGGADDVLAVCFSELDDPATDWVCVPGAECTIDQPSHSVDAGSCTVLGGDSAAWTLTDNGTIRVRARAARGRVPLKAY